MPKFKPNDVLSKSFSELPPPPNVISHSPGAGWAKRTEGENANATPVARVRVTIIFFILVLSDKAPAQFARCLWLKHSFYHDEYPSEIISELLIDSRTGISG